MPTRAPIHRPYGWVPPAQRQREHDSRRGSPRARGYDARWRRESKAFLALAENRYCCCGCGALAEVVDHRLPHRGDMVLFWDMSNWQPMTRACHSAKTARDDGGFGNPVSG